MSVKGFRVKDGLTTRIEKYDYASLEDIPPIEEELKDAKSAIHQLFNGGIDFEQGLYSVNNGVKGDAPHYIRSKSYVPKTVTVQTIVDPYALLVLAYENDTFVGAWDGSGFTPRAYIGINLVDLPSLSKRFPKYEFVINVLNKNSNPITPEDANTFLYVIDTLDATSKIENIDKNTESIRKVLNIPYLYTDYAMLSYKTDHSYTWLRKRVAFKKPLFVKAGTVVKIETASDEQYSRLAWTVSEGTYTNILSEGWFTGDHTWNITEDMEIVVVFSKTNPSDMTPDDLNSKVWIIDNSEETALEKIQGDFENAIANQNASIYQLFKGAIDFEQGFYSNSDGSKGNAAHYIRSKSYVPKTVTVQAAVAPYVLIVLAYENGTFVGAWNGSDFVPGAFVGINLVDLPSFSKQFPKYEFVINVVGNASNPISPDDADTILYITDTLNATSKIENIDKNTESIRKVLNIPYLYTDYAILSYKQDHSYTWARNRVAFKKPLSIKAGSVVKIETASDERYSRVAWTVSEGTYTNVVWETWFTGDRTWNITEDMEIVVVFSKTNDSAISPDNLNSKVWIIDNSEETALEKIQGDFENSVLKTTIDLEYGYWGAADGAPGNAQHYVRSVGFIPKTYKIVLNNVSDRFLCNVAAYSDDGYVGIWDPASGTFVKTPVYLTEMDVSTLAQSYPKYSFKLNIVHNGGKAIEDINSVYDNISILDMSITDKEGTLPIYYEGYLYEKRGMIRDNINSVGKNGETFLFITDMHWETNHKQSPILVKDILDKTNVRLMICGGDLINTLGKNSAVNTIIDVVKAFTYPEVPMHMVYGNHDGNLLNWQNPDDRELNKLSANEIFGVTQKQTSYSNIYADGDAINYYFDRQDSKTRFIILDSGSYGEYASDTIPALCEMLLSTPTGYNIVIVEHWIVSGASPEVAELTSSAVQLMNVIKAYNDRSSYNEVSFSTAVGKVIGVIAGHTHYDYVIEVNDERNISGVPFIATADDSYRDRTAEVGTTDEQCFDVVTIDYTNRQFKFIRIGQGNNRTISY